MPRRRYAKRKDIATPLIFCDEHKCPMIQIGDEYVCVIEYVDALIGAHKVVDVIPGGLTLDPPVPISLIFDNGCSLPLLCPCCGGPITLDPKATGDQLLKIEDRLLEIAKDVYLVGLGYDAEQNGLVLAFSPDPEADLNDSEAVVDIVVHFDSIRGIEEKPVDRSGLMLDTSL